MSPQQIQTMSLWGSPHAQAALGSLANPQPSPSPLTLTLTYPFLSPFPFPFPFP